MNYPNDWSRCPVCNDFALDGHITCGRLSCNEAEQRRLRADRQRREIIEEARQRFDDEHSR